MKANQIIKLKINCKIINFQKLKRENYNNNDNNKIIKIKISKLLLIHNIICLQKFLSLLFNQNKITLCSLLSFCSK